MLEIGAISESKSPWTSAVVLVRKKDGSLRFCIDLRKLNSRTVKDAYSLARIDETLDYLNGDSVVHITGPQIRLLVGRVRLREQGTHCIFGGAIGLLSM